MLFPPGYTSIASLKRILSTRKGMTIVKQTMQDIMKKGTFICGSPATVREKIEAAHARSGFEKLVCMIQFGTLPPELVSKSLQLFAEEVMPKVRPLSPCNA